MTAPESPAAPAQGSPEATVWLLNQYRAAEIRGAGVILRLGRLADTSGLRSNFSRHLRDEGVHAWMWTRAIHELGGEVLDMDDAYQIRLGTEFGLPKSLTELLALTLVSERRGVQTYEEHLTFAGIPGCVERTLRGILKDEHWHVEWIAEELEGRAAKDSAVSSALARAEEADRRAASQLRTLAGVL
ncbi:MAG TPA: ferritin-like domain-containing protein [Acidimicrobiales bacterium]|nr:ferritin-like domain-containing protein [Acidimicrobiales bacterium]